MMINGLAIRYHWRQGAQAIFYYTDAWYASIDVAYLHMALKLVHMSVS